MCIRQVIERSRRIPFSLEMAPESRNFGTYSSRTRGGILRSAVRIFTLCGRIAADLTATTDCQGMNNLTATLLLTHPAEEDAFWVLCCIIEVRRSPDYFAYMLIIATSISENLAGRLLHFTPPRFASGPASTARSHSASSAERCWSSARSRSGITGRHFRMVSLALHRRRTDPDTSVRPSLLSSDLG